MLKAPLERLSFNRQEVRPTGHAKSCGCQTAKWRATGNVAKANRLGVPVCDCEGPRKGGSRFCNRCHKLWHKYRLTNVQYNSMLVVQGYGCAACKQVESVRDKHTGTIQSLAVDHNHTTDEVRRLFCSSCNTSYGKLNEDPATICSLLGISIDDSDLPDNAKRDARALLVQVQSILSLHSAKVPNARRRPGVAA